MTAAKEILHELDQATDAENIQIRRGNLNNYSILKPISVDRKRAMVETAAQDPVLDKIMGVMVGMAVGDALGHPYEFLPVTDEPTNQYFDLKTYQFKNESNVFALKRGQWTDDAAMGLCMADTFLMKRQFNGSDMRVRFWCWWNRGYNNAFRKDNSRSDSVGLGGNISKSLNILNMCRSVDDVPPSYDAKTEDAGNGSLMRFAPIPVYLHCAPLEEMHDIARKCSYTTHPGIIAAEACAFLAHLIRRALELTAPMCPREFLEKYTQDYYEVAGLGQKSGWGWDQMKWLVTSSPVSAKERCWNWKADTLDLAGTIGARGYSYNGYPVSEGYFGSYCMDGLAMALWSVYHTSSFDEAVTRSVNLLGDADSHGSITGQLAGALYGYSTINPKFVEWLAEWDDYEFAVRALLLHQVGLDNYGAK